MSSIHRSVNSNHPLTPLTLFLALIFFIPASSAETLRLAVAANFTAASKALVARFEEQTSHRLLVSYGSTGKLYAQIVHAAPFDIFLAADENRPRRLVEEGHAEAASRFTYAQGRLVLWSAQEGLFSDGSAYLKGGDYRRLAIANPDSAPYGMAAQQLLQGLGIWKRLSPRLVRGDSITQAFQFVATGNAEVGLVAASQLKAWPHKGSLWDVPEEYYQPIVQQAVLLHRARGSDAALAFMRFLKSDEARGVIRDFGYAVE
jgi:molybdate transport system substrate-binding protein